MKKKRSVVVWHGEGRSLFHVVEERPEPELWEVVASFESRRRAELALGAWDGELEALRAEEGSVRL